jgi:hypothetical protein
MCDCGVSVVYEDKFGETQNQQRNRADTLKEGIAGVNHGASCLECDTKLA